MMSSMGSWPKSRALMLMRTETARRNSGREIAHAAEHSGPSIMANSARLVACAWSSCDAGRLDEMQRLVVVSRRTPSIRLFCVWLAAARFVLILAAWQGGAERVVSGESNALLRCRVCLCAYARLYTG